MSQTAAAPMEIELQEVDFWKPIKIFDNIHYDFFLIFSYNSRLAIAH